MQDLQIINAMRFIPAYAGNASAPRDSEAGRPVHPRIRGERRLIQSASAALTGSSPHTRGTRLGFPVCLRFQRFIPAYAGNAHSRFRKYGCEQVHPRIRGERSRNSAAPMLVGGSSPHTRGTLRMTILRSGIALVHPRIRGERLPPYISSRSVRGSSPHTRGTRC